MTDMSNLLLLDTNVLSPEKFAVNDSWFNATLVTASTSAQELLGMQRPDREMRYRYALPVMDSHLFKFHTDVPTIQFLRWASEHAKHAPVSRQTDSLRVPASRLRAESRELGHAAIATAHEKGHDRLFHAYASRGLRPKQLRRVLEKWEFLRSEVETVIPLDYTVAACAVSLANKFVDAGLHVKGTARNTMNDMYVAATSLTTGIPLATDDIQLRDFYREHGWKVTNGDLYIASPEPPPEAKASKHVPAQKGDRYLNQPLGLRSQIDQKPPTGR